MLGGLGLVLLAIVGTLAYLWSNDGPQQLSASTAVQRFRAENHGAASAGPGPTQGIYLYRGSGTESLSVPPKSQGEGPEIPGTVTNRPGGCFDFRLDFSDAHWQSWRYCIGSDGLTTTSKSGYYRWDFVVFSASDTSTYTCDPAILTVPAAMTVGGSHPVTCTGSNDSLSTGPVHMKGTSTVVATKTLRVAGTDIPAVRIREAVAFTGGQTGSNDADTWFSTTTGLPLEGTWSTVVSTPSPFGTSTMRAQGQFTLTTSTPRT